MKGIIDDFIRRMDERSNGAATYGVKVTYLELRDMGRRHQITYGESRIEEFIHLLDELGNHPEVNQRARPIIKLHAEALHRRFAER